MDNFDGGVDYRDSWLHETVELGQIRTSRYQDMVSWIDCAMNWVDQWSKTIKNETLMYSYNSDSRIHAK